MSTPAPSSVVDLTGWSADDLATLLQRLVAGPVGYTPADMRLRTPFGHPATVVLLAEEARQPDAAAALEKLSSFIDYYRGRAIKMRLTAGVVDGHAYDRNTTPGSFASLAALVALERGIPPPPVP